MKYKGMLGGPGVDARRTGGQGGPWCPTYMEWSTMIVAICVINTTSLYGLCCSDEKFKFVI